MPQPVVPDVNVSEQIGPGISPQGAWYDEMLISGRTIIVIGYSYARGGTEIGLITTANSDDALRKPGTVGKAITAMPSTGNCASCAAAPCTAVSLPSTSTCATSRPWP